MMKQNYEGYTADDHKVWELLYGRQMDVLKSRATGEFFVGLEKVGFEPDKIPHFEVVNEHLAQLTGWEVYEVPGIVDDAEFFRLMAGKKFPATTWIRKMEQLEYLEEPDMFHDVFGHVPLLANQQFCDFLQGLSQVAVRHIESKDAVELMSRLYWFTVEFGLIQESGNKIYGAGILSSPGESVFSLESKEVGREHFDMGRIFETPYIKEKFQEKYYIVDSYEQLYESLPHIEATLEDTLSRPLVVRQ